MIKITDKFDTVEMFLDFITHYTNDKEINDGVYLLKNKFNHILNKLNNGLYTETFNDILNDYFFQNRDFIRDGFPRQIFKIFVLLKKENERGIKKEEVDIYEFIGKRS